MKKLTIVQNEENKRKYDVVDGNVVIEINSVIDPGSAKKVEGKLIITKNFIGILPAGKKITEIATKLPREFYSIFEINEEIVVATDKEEALDLYKEVEKANKSTEEVEAEDDKVEFLTRSTIDGIQKNRLTKAEKQAYKDKWLKEMAYTVEFRSTKTVKDKVIMMAEAGYPLSAIAYTLDKRYQQVRSYVVTYMGRNIKAL